MYGRILKTLILALLVSAAPLTAAEMQDKGMMKEQMDEMKMIHLSGDFAGVGRYDATGQALLKTADGKTVLHLNDISVTRIPDGQIYLATDGKFKKGLHLGQLNQFSGDVRFNVPEGAAIGSYNTVVIWCRAFDVRIGEASLIQGTP